MKATFVSSFNNVFRVQETQNGKFIVQREYNGLFGLWPFRTRYIGWKTIFVVPYLADAENRIKSYLDADNWPKVVATYTFTPETAFSESEIIKTTLKTK